MAGKKKRKYPSGGKKTTTKDGKNEYMKNYMRDYRRDQKQRLEELKQQFPGAYELIFGRQRK